MIESEDSASDASPTLTPEDTTGASPGRCACSVLQQMEAGLGDGGEPWEQAERLVSIPSAAHGYLDPQSGKQAGSFRTYVIRFKVSTRQLSRSID